MDDSPAPKLRMLAPVAVGVFAVALLAVLIGSGALFGGDPPDRASTEPPQRPGDADRRRDRREPSRGAATYTVQAGDTLGSIAEETEVSVERLRELNPGLDPQVLSTGQRIRLRE